MSGRHPAGPGFSEEQLERYSRHIVLAEVGLAGQRRLRDARVCVLGVGGLGSPVVMYLAAAGVGRLGLIDGDRVDLSNLQRQIVHASHAQGMSKAESARVQVAALNPHVDVVTHPVELNRDNALGILADYDIIVDGTDNFHTRYLANDAAYLLGIPLVHGSIFRFEGQIADFIPGKGCYRCLYPVPPPPGLVPACRQAGVLNALPGIVGTVQAMEAIKLITGIGKPLVGRLLLHDALAMTFREVRIRRDRVCALCGDTPTIRELIDYEAFVGGTVATTSG